MNNQSVVNRWHSFEFSVKASIITNIILYLIVSIQSLRHAFKFFEEAAEIGILFWPIVATAAFEIGQIASLFALNVLKKSNKGLIWGLFLFLTFVQTISNIGYAYAHIDLVKDVYFSALTSFFTDVGLPANYLVKLKPIFSFLYGGSLPILAVLFIKSIMGNILGEEIVPQPTSADSSTVKAVHSEPIEVADLKDSDNLSLSDNVNEDVPYKIPEASVEHDVSEVSDSPSDSLSVDSFDEALVSSPILESSDSNVEVIDPVEDSAKQFVDTDEKVKVKVVEKEGQYSFKDIKKSELTYF